MIENEDCARGAADGSAPAPTASSPSSSSSAAADPAASLFTFREAHCCVCGIAAPQVPYCAGAIDHLHGVPGVFSYTRCGTCGSLFQNPQITPETIGAAYPASYAPWVPPPLMR